MNTSLIKHSDNINVKRGRFYGPVHSYGRNYSGDEYLAVTFREPEEGYVPYEVSLYRYCVPGRCDTYHFDYVPSGNCSAWKLRYFSDGQMSLPDALKLATEDLNKSQVAKLLVEACSQKRYRYYSRILINDILAMVGPKTKSYRACEKAFDKMMEEVKVDFAAKKEAALVPVS